MIDRSNQLNLCVPPIFHPYKSKLAISGEHANQFFTERDK